MTLSTKFERISLPLEHPFTIARGTQETAENVIVRITDKEGNVGVGAAAPDAHYGETVGTVEAVLPILLELVESVDDVHALARVEAQMNDVVRGNPAAKAAVSVALHDLAATSLGVPLYRYWGLDPDDAVTTSYTIGIDSRERMVEKTEEALARSYSTLKIKVGGERGHEPAEAVRDVAPDATIRVDANEAWSPREAVRNIEKLADLDIEFVEQPISAGNPDGLQFVRERSALPIAADESCVRLSDIPRVVDQVDIVNLKLMKCGGLREAIRMIHAARAHDLEVMFGCMIESNASIAAAAHLSPLLDYADLDGSLLLAENRFEGVPMEGGQIDLQSITRPGSGCWKNAE